MLFFAVSSSMPVRQIWFAMQEKLQLQEWRNVQPRWRFLLMSWRLGRHRLWQKELRRPHDIWTPLFSHLFLWPEQHWAVSVFLGPSINDEGNWERGRVSKIGQNCRWIVLKNCLHGGGGFQKSGKIPTSFMDGPFAVFLQLPTPHLPSFSFFSLTYSWMYR